VSTSGSSAGRRGGDAHPEFYALAESAAERVDDRFTQMAFDLVLDERGGDRQ